MFNDGSRRCNAKCEGVVDDLFVEDATGRSRFNSAVVKESKPPPRFRGDMIHHFTELNAYRKSTDLAGRIFTVSKRWPAEERFALTDQIRRASRSVGASLAESWGKRRYEAHFVSKLTDADAENHEVEHWLMSAHGAGYLNEREVDELVASKREVGRLLGTMILTPGLFLIHERRPHSALPRMRKPGDVLNTEDGGRLF